MTKKPARLDQGQFFKAAQWLLANRERMLKEKPSFSSVCRELALALGMDRISDHTLETLRQCTGVNWEAAFVRYNPSKMRPLIDALEVKVQGLEKRVGELEDMILRLLDKPAAKMDANNRPDRISAAHM